MIECCPRGLSELRSLLGGKDAFYSPGSEPPREKGTYVLVFAVRKQANVKTTYGFTKLKPGIYAYVGSAFGPGGLKARILRHWRQEKKIHWHIDWITTSEACEHIGAFVFVGKRIESEIAGLLERKYKAVPGFGASDSKEDSHLFKIC